MNGPLLIAANHPNSFLDAIIIATIFKRPVYSLTRGDVYANRLLSALLEAMNMLPVYRISEGADKLDQNYLTFGKCREIFKKNGIVLIFSEGRCENEWHLRPLKKGTARLAISSWEEKIPLTVLPAGINYQSFLTFGKNVEINFGTPIRSADIDLTNVQGKVIGDFNELLLQNLQPLVAEYDKGDPAIKKRFEIKQSFARRSLLMLPAMIGWGLHAPLYSVVQQYTWKKAGHSGHYDSILVALLFITYPFYLAIAAALVVVLVPGLWWPGVFVLFPFCAWSYLQLKKQF